jgi:hypothetical protein
VSSEGHRAPEPRLRGSGGVPWLLALAYLLLVALGVLLGLYGAFLVPRGPRVDGHVLSVGVLVAVVGNVCAGLLGGRAAGRFGGVAVFVGWLITVFTLSIQRASGTVVLPGSGDLAFAALLFLLLGTVAGAVASALASGNGVMGRRRVPKVAPDEPNRTVS